MVNRDVLTNFIYDSLGRDLLATAANVDTVPNSVQIKGVEEVGKVAIGVSASIEFIEKAVDWGAHYLIVHHGLHTGWITNGRFDPYEHRLRLIFKNDLTLAGFHYSLDAHPTIGNNAIIIERLGAKRLNEPYFNNWGWVGEFETPIEVKTLAKTCSEVFAHDVFTVYAGPDRVKRIGVCSGGARPGAREFLEIVDTHIDLHITGEINESGPYAAEEGGYNYIAGGHYATEVFGVQALGKLIGEKFNDRLEVKFIDVQNPL
jgi:dinuclear metal center YbgI/SA1388 family protein